MAATVELEPERQTSAAGNALVALCSTKAGWTSEAPGKVRKAGDAAAYVAWLAEERRRGPLANVSQGENALTWGLTLVGNSPAAELVEIATTLGSQATTAKSLKPKQRARLADAVQQWLGWTKEGAHASDVEFAVAALAVGNFLPLAAGCCERETWWDAADALVRLASQDSGDGESAPAMLCNQLLGVELPLTLAAALPEIQRCRELGQLGADRLKESADQLLNGEGLPHGSLIGGLLPLTACWTRLAVIGQALKKSLWSKSAKAQFGWLVRQTLRWTAPNGQPLLADAVAAGWTPAFLQAALQAGGDESDTAAAETLLGRKFVGKAAGKAKSHEPPEPADHCEWSGVAVLRTDWTPQATTVAVDFTQATMRLDLRVGEQQVFDGPWEIDLRFGGKKVEFAAAWEETCWFSDADVDFIELTLELPGGASIERQVMLAREEKFLYLADYCTAGGNPRELQYQAKIPLASGCDFAAERETRDGLLVAGSVSLRTLPLGLGEWRADPRGGELAAVDGRLAWSADRSGVAIVAPLLLDLRSGRSQKQCTWRQLTVAEGLEIQSADVAVGYRAQSGKDQWIFYRSIAQRGNRTLLGQNTASEFFAARFLPETGTVEELVEIEG
ncbi:MAG: hypothetical protein KDA44_15560 [Planctomycetales bacterium]|nr:hypothetical protein [Planctomycetales bacterium]